MAWRNWSPKQVPNRDKRGARNPSVMRKADFGSSNVPRRGTWETHSQNMREELEMLLKVETCPIAAGRALPPAMSRSGGSCGSTMGSAGNFHMFVTTWLTRETMKSDIFWEKIPLSLRF